MAKGETKKRLLLVEDDPILRRRYLRELSKVFEVIQAHDYEQGLEKIALKKFDIMLSDLHLSPKGVGEGLDLISKARQLEPYRPIWAMSSDDDLHLIALRSGADQFWSKPFDPGLMAGSFENATD